ncbi:hypothetical protein EJ02DRAFT_424934 [Clathrospora elynae]|uniref:Uncharacterized protein n=1 Tax=Clathrospora elynae TaxID=706981 RepID=A0A6A5SQE3_9PLEO|nr:hypothetical protein EJ02DRAFT_424934 [Clathrospora elynae]
MLLAVINYIKTPQQDKLFTDCLEAANADLPAEAHLKLLQPIKPVVTCWISYFDAIKRATYLYASFDSYIEKHISRVAYEEQRDHLYINIQAAWSKANEYYGKLDNSPVYYAATCPHPYHKYCAVAQGVRKDMACKTACMSQHRSPSPSSREWRNTETHSHTYAPLGNITSATSA